MSMDLASTAALVARARELRDGGDAEGAIALLLDALEVVTADGDRFLAAFLTHDLGHAEREPEAQLGWHLACLAHIDAVGDDRVKGFRASAHANLGVTYLRLGAVPQAIEHCELGEAAVPDLPDDAYGQQIREGLDRLRAALNEATAG